jgi:pyruvate/2-oxoglutarate/acetoin dehydrogenase E1 component
MAITLRDTIKSIVKEHLQNKKRKAYGQCLTAVGWVGGTLPELYEDGGMIELSMADVAGGAIVVGAALANTRPIYVVRYQGFQWYNCVSIVNYAAKSKEMWQKPCPIFVRSIAMEGGIGPVAGSSHHSLYYRMPGIKIASPVSPNEYKQVYESFMNDDIPYYVSEHRKCFDISEDIPDYYEHTNPDLTIFPISVTRLEMNKLLKIAEQNNIQINISNILWIKPFEISDETLNSIQKSKFGGLVLDDDFEDGCQSSIANKISLLSGKKVWTLGLEDRTSGFSFDVDNLPPDAEKIFRTIKTIMQFENKAS